jgi:flagellar motor switch protein FliG
MADDAAAISETARKATALLIAMGRPLAQRLVARFNEQELRMLAQAARVLPPVNRAVMESLVEDFATNFVNRVANETPEAELDGIMIEGLGADAVGRIRTPEVPVAVKDVDPWIAIAAATPAKVAEILAHESDVVHAVVLNALPVQAAAKVLAAIETSRRALITKLVLGASTAAPLALKIIGNEVLARLTAPDPKLQETASIKRTAALLNALPRDASKAVLDAFGSDTPEIADRLKELMFGFEDVPKLDQKARVILLDSLQTDTLSNALFGATPDVTEAVLAALGARARRMVEAELASGNEPASDRVETARRTIADTALALAETGKIVLPSSTTKPAPDTLEKAAA